MYLWIIATLCAFFIKGLCGFANTLVFTSILGFGANNINISPVELVLGYPTNLILALRERKQISWRMCLPLAVLVILGSIPGVFVLKNVDTGIVKTIFGFIIILLGIEMLLREFHPKQMKQSMPMLILVGILSGLLCGLYGVGALLGAYLSRVTDNTHSFKANICVVFLVENTFRIILYACTDILHLAILKKALILAPFMLIGLFGGMFAGNILNEKLIKRLVILLLIISGFALIF